jgi:phosphoglycerate kinase
MKKLSSLSSKLLKGKRVLVRIDINSPLKNKKPIMNPRICATVKTISFLKKHGAKIILIAHQGRPEKKFNNSLVNHARLLSKYTKVTFIKDIVGKMALKEIDTMKNGSAILLENVRLHHDEFLPEKKRNELTEILSLSCDLYVNDAFSVSHRKSTSIISFPKVLPSFIGLTFEEEIENAEKITFRKNILYILGGNKTEDLISLFENRKILTGGTLSLLSLIACGKKLGTHEKLLEKDKKLLKILKKFKNHLILPNDLAYEKRGKREEIFVEDLPLNEYFFDIGKITTKNYVDEIMNSKVIFVKGPMGKVENSNFSYATREIYKALSKTKAKVIVAGGHSSTFLEKWNVRLKREDYISLSGGALVSYISGEKLPGIIALEKGIKK